MKIALIGYGKMGKEIEQLAVSRGHTIVLKVTSQNALTFTRKQLQQADVAIEFSTPAAAYNNIVKCLTAKVPIVVGTTGWLKQMEEIEKQVWEKNRTLFYASNYSIGVNLFYKVNAYLAKLMNHSKDYDISVEEIHHLQKLDAPSGTAIALANQIINEVDRKKSWVNNTKTQPAELVIHSKREAEVPGTHTVTYSSAIDEISITHKAHNRKGFALGAVLAAEWVKDKKGFFGMNELLGTTP